MALLEYCRTAANLEQSRAKVTNGSRPLLSLGPPYRPVSKEIVKRSPDVNSRFDIRLIRGSKFRAALQELLDCSESLENGRVSDRTGLTSIHMLRVLDPRLGPLSQNEPGGLGQQDSDFCSNGQ